MKATRILKPLILKHYYRGACNQCGLVTRKFI